MAASTGDRHGSTLRVDFMREVMIAQYGAAVDTTSTPDPGGDTSDDALWPTAAEKEAWTGLVSLVLLLPGRLESPLQQEPA